jgi:hypothetical protein
MISTNLDVKKPDTMPLDRWEAVCPATAAVAISPGEA